MDSVKLSVGHFGDEVVRLHESLKNHGFAVSATEAKRKFFGPSTRAAVWEFQKRQRLEVNGIVDQKTALALSSETVTTAGRSKAAHSVAAAPTLISTPDSSIPALRTAESSLPVGATVGLPAGWVDESNFAREIDVFPIRIDSNATTDVQFGPPTAGYILVSLYDMWTGPDFARRARKKAGATVIGDVATNAVAAPPDKNGGVGDGGGDGGGGGDGSGMLPSRFFRVELIPPFAVAGTILDAEFPFEFTVPASVQPRLQSVFSNLGNAPKWTLRITNTFEREAFGNLLVTYIGTRPILRKDLDLYGLNHLLEQVIGGSLTRPITVALENRAVEPSQNQFFTLETTWLILLPDPILQRQFGKNEFDLGVKIIANRSGEQVESEPMSVRLIVNDGRLALKTRIYFPSGTKLLLKTLLKKLIKNEIHNFVSSAIGSIPGLNVLGGAGSFLGVDSSLSLAEDAIIDFVEDAAIGDDVKLRTLGADICFTMRDNSIAAGVPSFGSNTCDVMIRPDIETETGSSTFTILVASIVEGLCSRAYDRGNPAYDALGKLRDKAELIWRTLGQYLLGRDRPELTSQVVPKIQMHFAGDEPKPATATTGESPRVPLPDPSLLAGIDHIVVLMMENRSFDQMLGHLSLPVSLGGAGRRDVNGLNGTEFCLKRDGSRAYVFPFTHSPATLFGYDPGHSFRDQLVQRGGQTLALPTTSIQDNPNKPPIDDDSDDDGPNQVIVPAMGGFVLSYQSHLAEKYTVAELSDVTRNYGRSANDIMGYHLPASVPIYSFLASNALICDRWYAAHPGDTWPNRFITLTGNLAPRSPHDPHAGLPETGTPFPQNFTPLHVRNIFDYLTAGDVTWRYYEHDMCMLRLFADYTLGHPNIVQIDDPVQGLKAAVDNDTLPSVVFIDPDLTDIPAGNDDHPPTDIAGGQRLVKRVYDTLSSNKRLWAKTMLIVTYDEYGGFYDHVLPPEVSDPADPNYVSPMFTNPEFPEQAPPGRFNPVPVHYRGPRVPTFIVSPWVEAGTVSHLVFDHTSILKTIITRFLHDNPPRLGERVDRANGLQNVLSAPVTRVGGGTGSVLEKSGPRVAAISPELPALKPDAIRAIPPGQFVDDFRTLMSAVRDRNRPH